MPYFDTGTGRLHYEYEGDAALPVSNEGVQHST